MDTNLRPLKGSKIWRSKTTAFFHSQTGHDNHGRVSFSSWFGVAESCHV